jgi:hypothetical protein
MTNFGELIKKEISSNTEIVCNKDDVVQAVILVKDLMGLMLKECIEKYPMATNSIGQMSGAVFQLGMLEDWVREELEK